MSTPANPNFSTTNWSVVLAAAHSDPATATVALERLCQRYWFPVYAFLSRQGRDTHECEDLTQGFFHFVLERQTLGQVDRRKGRFRTFLLTVLTNYLHNERDRAKAHKRGGRHQFISLDQLPPDCLQSLETANGETPEAMFERQWGIVLVARVLDELRREHERRNRAAIFAGLQPFLTDEPAAKDYEHLALQLGMEAGAVKVALHRARRRFGELLRNEIAHTVEAPDEIEAEIRHLLAAIAR